jgi:hypothetical protein
MQVASISGKVLADKNLVMWFAENTDGYDDRLTTIPIGLGYPKNVDAHDLCRHLKPFSTRTRLLYLNFNFRTNPKRNGTFAVKQQ